MRGRAAGHGASLRDQRGVSRAGCLFGILILIIAGYVGVQLVGMEIDYRALSSQAQRSARAANETPNEVLAAQIRAKATELALPPAAGSATIRRLPGNRITIAVQYPDSLSVFGQWYWVWNRRIDIEHVYTNY